MCVLGCVCVCVCERERERERVCMYVRERESVCVCVCVCAADVPASGMRPLAQDVSGLVTVKCVQSANV